MPEWAFACNEHMTRSLREAHQALVGGLTPFFQQVLLMRPKDMKANFGAEFLLSELPKFVALKTVAGEIDKNIGQLQRVFKAMGKA